MLRSQLLGAEQLYPLRTAPGRPSGSLFGSCHRAERALLRLLPGSSLPSERALLRLLLPESSLSSSAHRAERALLGYLAT